MADREEIEREIQRLDGRWWHSIDLGGGLVTRGHKSAKVLRREFDNLQVDFADKSVLDIGAWDGFFSFAAEQAGASRVVALDHFAWSIDPFMKGSYLDQCAREGVVPQPFDQVRSLWDPVTLPGRQCFDAARSALNSRVEPVVADFMAADLAPIGTFDVVLFLGVLYHLPDPVRAIERLASVTHGVAIIETEAVVVPGYERASLWESYPSDELAGDPTNWWAPSEVALRKHCLASGFREVRVTAGNPRRALTAVEAPPSRSALRRVVRRVRPLPKISVPVRYRLTVQAWK